MFSLFVLRNGLTKKQQMNQKMGRGKNEKLLEK
jgi:hypothetical protein